MNAVKILARTVFFYVAGVFWTGFVAYVLIIPVAIVERLLRPRGSHFAHTLLFNFVGLCSLPWRLVADVHIQSETRVAEGEAVVISNHHSFIDIFLLFHIFPRIHMTTRLTLNRIPFLGWAIQVLQHIPHHEDRPEEALDTAAEWIRRGITVGFFPEGTRAPTGTVGVFRNGAFRLAQRTTELVQPVVVAGTGRVWGKGRFWVRHLGPVAMKVLPPVAVPAAAGRLELRRIIHEIRDLMVAEHRALEMELFAEEAGEKHEESVSP